MAKVQDVARFFIDIAQKQDAQGCGDLMTNLRLQKLLYFAQGWHLARFGKPLFQAPIEAWKHGPVVPEVYHTYKSNKNQGISDVPAPPEDAFTEEEYALLLDVAREYSGYSTNTLVSMSHANNAPWAHAEQSDIIPQREIQAYFAGKEPLPSFDDLLERFPVEEY